MLGDDVIRRLKQVAHRHGWDGAFALLLASALLLGGAPALAGLARMAKVAGPGMAAKGSERSAAMPSADVARLSLDGFPDSGRFAPQLLYPVVAHGFPAWMHTATVSTAPALRSAHAVIAICIDDLGEDITGTDKAMALPP